MWRFGLKETEERLDELGENVSYDQHSGEFRWTKTRGNGIAGNIAGSKSRFGYIVIGFEGFNYMAHRLAFYFVHGLIPTAVDHVNGVRHDNRIDNLRPANSSINGKNAKLRSDNKTGLMGVSKFISRSGELKYLAKCRVNCREKYLLSTSDFFEAVCARKSAENLYGYHDNHGRAG